MDISKILLKNPKFDQYFINDQKDPVETIKQGMGKTFGGMSAIREAATEAVMEVISMGMAPDNPDSKLTQTAIDEVPELQEVKEALKEAIKVVVQIVLMVATGGAGAAGGAAEAGAASGAQGAQGATGAQGGTPGVDQTPNTENMTDELEDTDNTKGDIKTQNQENQNQEVQDEKNVDQKKTEEEKKTDKLEDPGKSSRKGNLNVGENNQSGLDSLKNEIKSKLDGAKGEMRNSVDGFLKDKLGIEDEGLRKMITDKIMDKLESKQEESGSPSVAEAIAQFIINLGKILNRQEWSVNFEGGKQGSPTIDSLGGQQKASDLIDSALDTDLEVEDVKDAGETEDVEDKVGVEDKDDVDETEETQDVGDPEVRGEDDGLEPSVEVKTAGSERKGGDDETRTSDEIKIDLAKQLGLDPENSEDMQKLESLLNVGGPKGEGSVKGGTKVDDEKGLTNLKNVKSEVMDKVSSMLDQLGVDEDLKTALTQQIEKALTDKLEEGDGKSPAEVIADFIHELGQILTGHGYEAGKLADAGVSLDGLGDSMGNMAIGGSEGLAELNQLSETDFNARVDTLVDNLADELAGEFGLDADGKEALKTVLRDAVNADLAGGREGLLGLEQHVNYLQGKNSIVDSQIQSLVDAGSLEKEDVKGIADAKKSLGDLYSSQNPPPTVSKTFTDALSGGIDDLTDDNSIEGPGRTGKTGKTDKTDKTEKTDGSGKEVEKTSSKIIRGLQPNPGDIMIALLAKLAMLFMRMNAQNRELAVLQIDNKLEMGMQKAELSREIAEQQKNIELAERNQKIVDIVLDSVAMICDIAFGSIPVVGGIPSGIINIAKGITDLCMESSRIYMKAALERMKADGEEQQAIIDSQGETIQLIMKDMDLALEMAKTMMEMLKQMVQMLAEIENKAGGMA